MPPRVRLSETDPVQPVASTSKKRKATPQLPSKKQRTSRRFGADIHPNVPATSAAKPTAKKAKRNKDAVETAGVFKTPKSRSSNNKKPKAQSPKHATPKTPNKKPTSSPSTPEGTPAALRRSPRTSQLIGGHGIVATYSKKRKTKTIDHRFEAAVEKGFQMSSLERLPQPDSEENKDEFTFDEPEIVPGMQSVRRKSGRQKFPFSSLDALSTGH